MLRIVLFVFGALVTVFRSRRDLVLENLVLKQQLAAFKARQPAAAHPRLRPRVLDRRAPALEQVE